MDNDRQAIEEDAQKFRDILEFFNPQQQQRLRNAPDLETFSEILGNKFQNKLELWRARSAYVGEVVPPAQLENSSVKPSERNEMTSAASALGDLGGVAAGLTISRFVPSDYNLEDLQADADAYAKGKAEEWNSNKNIATAQDAKGAYEKAKLEYYDYVVQEKPEMAKRLAKGKKDMLLVSAIERDEARKKQYPKNTPKVVSEDSVKKLKAIELASGHKASKLKTKAKAERLDLLQKFGGQDLMLLNAHLVNAGIGELKFDKQNNPQLVPLKPRLVTPAQPSSTPSPTIIQTTISRPTRVASSGRIPRKGGRLGNRRLRSKSFNPGRSLANKAKSKIKRKIEIGILLNPITWIVGGFLAILLLLLITPLVIFGKASTDGQFAQSVGLDSYFNNTPQTSGAPVPSGPMCQAGTLPEAPDCSTSSSSAIDSSLLSNFGLTITGNSADCVAKEEAFTTFSELFQSSKYSSLVKNAQGTTITMTNDACSGLTKGDSFRIGDCNNHSLPYFYVHEMGHVIRNKNASVRSAFENALPSLINSDKNCYSGQFLKTYLLRSGVDPKSESFAESIALYYLGGRKAILDPSKGFYGEDITDFKSQCPATYGWIKDNIFGGYEFDSSSAGSCSVGATTDSCGGAYNISQNPTGKNFGDPSCELVSNGAENKQLVANELMKQLTSRDKAKDFCKWACIIHGESGFDPNSYNGHASRPNLGAWGLFQFLPYASYDISKPKLYYRAGNVSWRDQISRALTYQYNYLIPWQTGVKTNGYWSTYKSHCYLEPDWKPGGSCIPNTTGGIIVP